MYFLASYGVDHLDFVLRCVEVIVALNGSDKYPNAGRRGMGMAYINPIWVREFRGIVGQADNSPPPGRRSLGSTWGVVLSFLKAFFFKPFGNQFLVAGVHVYTRYYCTVCTHSLYSLYI